MSKLYHGSQPVIFHKGTDPALKIRNEFEAALEQLRKVHPAVVMSHNGRGKSCYHCLRCGKNREDKDKLRRLPCR